MIYCYCTHCKQQLRNTPGADPDVPWVHEHSGNGFCDVDVPEDAVMFAGTPGRAEATPDPVRLCDDAIAALEESYELIYVSYSEGLNEKQVQVLLDGENWCESKEFDYQDENEGIWRRQGAEDVVKLVLDEGEDQIDLLESSGEYDRLIEEIEDRDRSDVVGALFRNTHHMLFRYDLDHDVPPDPWAVDSDEIAERMQDIAETAGLDISDEEVSKRIRSLVEEASYGGRLYAFFYGDPEDALRLADPNDPYVNGGVDHAEPQTVTFTGVYLVVLDHWNGSGHDEKFDSVTVPWRKRQVSVDARGVGPGYCWDDIAGLNTSAYGCEISFGTRQAVSA